MSTSNPLAWRTSTYTSNGEACVEVAPVWRTSSRSGNGENCVEIAPAWRTSTHTSNGENCVELAPAAESVLVRHSKHPDDGTIAFPYAAWTAFVRDALDGQPGANGIVTIAEAGPGTLVKSLHTGVELLFDPGEWTAFLDGAADGEFDFTSQPASPAS